MCVRAQGVTSLDPDDAADGGWDLSDADAIERLKGYLRGLASVHKLVVHFAPPCRTFSRARDRSVRTRLRSSAEPWGLSSLRGGQNTEVLCANRIAEHVAELADFLDSELGAYVSVEGPRNSYVWLLARYQGHLAKGWHFVTASPCMYGAGYPKPTAFLVPPSW